MIQTFQFRTEATDKTYYHTIYSANTRAAVDKWVRKIEDLQDQIYSFDPGQVLNIKQQYLNGELQVHVDREPYFLTYQVDDRYQTVHIDRINKGEADFIAKVTYLTTKEGGRKSYAASGYRPHVKFDGRKELTSGEQLFIDKDKVFPGEMVTAEIRILGKEFFKKYLYVGQHFEVAEASHVVGHGEILEIVNVTLLRDNE